MIDKTKRQATIFYPTKKNRKLWDKEAKKQKKSISAYLEESLEVFHTEMLDSNITE